MVCLLFMLFRRIETSEWKWFVCFLCYFLCVEFLHQKKKKHEIGLMTSITLLLSLHIKFVDYARTIVLRDVNIFQFRKRLCHDEFMV